MLMNKVHLIVDYPAYAIYEPLASPLQGLPVAKAGDIIGLPIESRRYSRMWKFFRFGSVASYALEYDDDPISAYEKAKERGHKCWWLNAESVSITKEMREKESRVGFQWGDKVWFEGHTFEIIKEANDNAGLKLAD